MRLVFESRQQQIEGIEPTGIGIPLSHDYDIITASNCETDKIQSGFCGDK